MSIYKTFSSLKYNTLKSGDTVYLSGNEYTVQRSHLNVKYDRNDRIFILFGLNKEIFCSEMYGYRPFGGGWPESRRHDYRALTRVVLALMLLSEGCCTFQIYYPKENIPIDKKGWVYYDYTNVLTDDVRKKIYGGFILCERKGRIFKNKNGVLCFNINNVPNRIYKIDKLKGLIEKVRNGTLEENIYIHGWRVNGITKTSFKLGCQIITIEDMTKIIEQAKIYDQKF